MIVLDTHIWVWWVHGDDRLPAAGLRILTERVGEGLGVSVISCWEVAKLVQYDRLRLPCSVDDWFDSALAYPGVVLLELTPRIAVESTQLPAPFHKDPADQIIVATSRVYRCELMTLDDKLRGYPHVNVLP